MKRFLALLALVLVLMAGTAGMASADIHTFTFEKGTPEVSDSQEAAQSYIPPFGSPFPWPANLNWHGEGGGHLYCSEILWNSVIPFTNPTRVNSFQMNGLPWELAGAYTFGPMNIAAVNAAGVTLWSDTVYLANYTDWDNWLTLVVNKDDVKDIIFYARGSDYDFIPSIDNLVINDAPPVPIPASVLLLGSGLLALVGLRKKFTR